MAEHGERVRRTASWRRLEEDAVGKLPTWVEEEESLCPASRRPGFHSTLPDIIALCVFSLCLTPHVSSPRFIVSAMAMKAVSASSQGSGDIMWLIQGLSMHGRCRS